MAGGGATAGLAGLQLLQAKQQADALQAQADFEAQQLAFNSQLVQLQREDILANVDEDVDRRNSEVRRMLGMQKVSLAAQGIEVESELGMKLEEDERLIGIEDVHAIKNNAWREALGLEIKATDLSAQSQFARISGGERARSTLVTGGLSAAGTGLTAFHQFETRRIRSGSA